MNLGRIVISKIKEGDRLWIREKGKGKKGWIYTLTGREERISKVRKKREGGTKGERDKASKLANRALSG